MSSWFDLRYRSGDTLSARIRDLIQKQIDAQSEVTDVTDEQVIQPVIPLASKTVWRDHLFKTKLKTVVEGQITKLPIDPDGKEMRLWFYNHHGGRYLTDSSFQGNLGELMGSEQSKLLDNTDDDGISNTRNVNWLVGDQHIRVHDNPSIQLKNIHTTETGFTIFIRVFLPFLNNENQYGKRGVLFSKLDDEQVTFGYVCQISDEGDAYFIVRDSAREYSLTAADLFPSLINNLIPDFNAKDFNSLDFLTVATLENLIPPTIPYDDLAFTYEFSTHRMQIIKNGVVFADSNNNPEGTGLVGWWRIVEGGDIGNTPDEPTSFTRTVYNSAVEGPSGNGTITTEDTQDTLGDGLIGWWAMNEGSGTNIEDYSPNNIDGTLVNGDWNSDILVFDNNDTHVEVDTINGGLNTLTTNFSFATWAFITAGEGPYAGLVSHLNGASTNPSNLLIDPVSASSTTILWQARTSTDTTVQSSVSVGGVTDGWHHFAVTYDGTNVRIYLDGNIELTDPQTYTLKSGTSKMKLGWGSDTIFHLTGNMRNTRLYDRKLTDNEVTELFQNGHLYDPVTTTGPIWTTLAPELPHETYLLFDGTNTGNISIPNYTAIQNLGDYSISLWYYPRSNPTTGETHRLINKNWSNNGSYICRINNPSGTPQLEFTIKNDSGNDGTVTVANPFPTLDTWYHILIRAPSSTFTPTVLINNVKTTGTAANGTVSTGTTSNLTIAHISTQVPDGFIHDVKYWTRELSDAEVTTLYNNGHPHAGFPKWEENPPPPPAIPEPITNPFKVEYNLPKPSSGVEWIKLHKLVASGFTQVYSKADGTTIPEQTVPFSTVYEVTDTSGGPSGGGGGGGTPSTIYNVTTGSSGQHLEFEDGVTRAGIKFNSGNPHLNKIVTRVIVQFRKQNSPSGTASVTVRSAGGTLRTTLGTFSPGSVGSGEQTVTINSTSNTYQMVADDVVSVEYPSGSNTIELTEIDPSGPNDQSGFTSVVSTGGSFSNNSRLLTMVIDAATAGGGGGSGTGYPLFAVSGHSGGTDCNFGNWTQSDTSHVGAHISGSSAEMHGKTLSRITVKLSKVGNPPGSVEVSTRNGDITGSKTVWGTVSNTSITTSPQDFTFTKLANTDVMNTTDSVVLWATTTGGDASNYFVVHASGTSVEAGVHVRYRVWNKNKTCFPSGGSYTLENVTTQDITGKFESGGQVTPAKLHYYDLNGGAVREVGEEIVSSSSVLNGKKITRVKPKLKAVGNPSGTIKCIIRNSSGTEVSQLGSIEANTVSPTTFEEKEFTNILQSRTLTTGDRVMIQYTGTSNAYIQVMVKHDEGASTGGDKVVTLSSGGNFTNVDADLSGTMFVGGTATDPGAYERVGEKVDLSTSILRLKKISKVLVWLRKVGNPLGTSKVFCRIRRQLDDATQTNIGEVLVSSITTAAAGTQKTFVSAPVSIYAVQTDDTILIEYPEGDDNNYVEVAVTDTDSIDSNKSIMVGYDALFQDYDLFPGKDLIATMSSGGDTFTPTGDEIPPAPPPAYTHDLHISAGGYPYTYYTDTTTIENWIGTVAPDIRWYRKILTTDELLNIYQNRRDRSSLPLGQVCVLGYFSLPQTTV